MRSATLVNILEDEMESIQLDKDAQGHNAFKLEFNPFEIKTVKLVVA